MEINKKYSHQFLSFVLLTAFIFCTTVTFAISPINQNTSKTIQKQSKSNTDNESFILDKLEEDGDDDDSVDTPLLTLAGVAVMSLLPRREKVRMRVNAPSP